MTRLQRLEKAEDRLDRMRRDADSEEYWIEKIFYKIQIKLEDAVVQCDKNFSCFNYLAIGTKYVESVKVTGIMWGGITFERNFKHTLVERAHNNILDLLDYERNSKWYEECSNPYRFKGEEGLYFHVINKYVKEWESYLFHFAGIDGEVCTSRLTDTPMKRRHNFVGLLLKGTPTAFFPFDCWSRREPKGRFRVATRKEFNSLRNEFWVIPATCQIKAVVMRKFDKKVADAAAALNIPIQYYNYKNDNYEA